MSDTYQLTFTLDDTESSDLNPTIVDGFPSYGVFDIMIRPVDIGADRPNAKFCVARVNGDKCGRIVRIICAKGSESQLDMSWDLPQGLSVFYRPAPKQESQTKFIMKVSTV